MFLIRSIVYKSSLFFTKAHVELFYLFEPVKNITDVLFLYTGEAHSLKVENILYQGKSPYQEILVFEVILHLLG